MKALRQKFLHTILFVSLLLGLTFCTSSEIFKVDAVRAIPELEAEALKSNPPAENGVFNQSDLVELIKLDSTFHLDIRYATENNFLGTKLYTQARAFLQRPAAEAVVNANKILHSKGYGILIHDAYRPWYVTKIFWDATPVDKHDFVADPSKGSRHNRGCAVDLTLFYLRTGLPVKMPSLYDEMTERAFYKYSGGTDDERNARDLLREVMEAEGFKVYENEWWHFDYKDWKSYSIQNIRFEEIK